jgi:hypothetical protein
MSQDDQAPGSIDVEVGELHGGTRVLAASVGNAGGLLTSVDTFVEQQSPFDRQARLNLSTDVVEVTLDMYLDYVGSQVVAWSPAELRLLSGAVLPSVAEQVRRFDVELPEVIYLVKTTGQEEGHAAYTRHRNVIVLPQNMVVSLFAGSSGDPLHEGGATTYLTNIVLHELFHIISKNNPAIRSRLYEGVGFRQTGDPVELPQVPWPDVHSTTSLAELKITNPDTPLLDVYIEMDVPERPGGATVVRKSLLPVLVATRPYGGGSFFDYLEWQFLAIRSVADRWVAELDDDQRPMMYPSQGLLAQYETRIGRNLDSELFHPDEILAQNWVFVANQPSLDLLVHMAQVLTAAD